MAAILEETDALLDEELEALVGEKLLDAEEAPGIPIDFTPREAKLAGAFVDDAVNYDDALAASLDIL